MNEIEIIENDDNAKIIVNGQIQKGVKSYKFERKNYNEYELTLILDVNINNSIEIIRLKNDTSKANIGIKFSENHLLNLKPIEWVST